MDDDDELERLLAELTRLCDEATARQAQEMFDRIDEEAQPVEVGPDQVVLLGYEGQVDCVWSVPSRPEVLLRPLRQPMREMLDIHADPLRPTYRTAEYRRIGEFTYQRET